MSGKLDQSLDDIVKTQRTGGGRRGRGGRRSVPGGAARPAATAPAGGVAKSARAPRGPRAPVARAAPVVPSSGESKIIVSGLPADVTEQQIKDYFSKSIGPVKRAFLTYGPNGQSRGIATIFFRDSGSAAQAASSLNGVKVDNRPMKIEVIVGAAQVAAVPAAKGLGDRIAKPKPVAKAQPKPAAGGAQNAAGAAKTPGQGRNGRKGKRGASKPKPKSAEELDAEMMDYFAPDAGNGASGEANGAAPVAATQPVAAAGGDGMVEDEIM